MNLCICQILPGCRKFHGLKGSDKKSSNEAIWVFPKKGLPPKWMVYNGKTYEKWYTPRSLTASLPPEKWCLENDPASDIWVSVTFQGRTVRFNFRCRSFLMCLCSGLLVDHGPCSPLGPCGFWLRDFSHNGYFCPRKNWKTASENQVGLFWTK